MKIRSAASRVVFLVTVALMFVTALGEAATLVVSNTNDKFARSLRQAVQDANPLGGDNIVFQIPVDDPGYDLATGVFRIVLTSGELAIAKDLTIDGGGQKIVLQTGAPTYGRIFHVTSGVVMLARLQITGGILSTTAANEGGGGILHSGGNLTVSGCTVSGNNAFSGDGGGICNRSGSLSLINSTIANNLNQSIYSTARGAGIYNEAGAVLVVDSSTVAGNSNASQVAGIYNNGSARLRNTIVARNDATALAQRYVADVSGAFISDGFNLIGNGAGSTGLGGSGSHDQVGTATTPANPNLAALRYNGGPTPTLEPLPGSLVIDQGNRGNLTTDQRGSPRPVDQPGIVNGGDGSDIGAVEVGLPQAGPTFTVTNTYERDQGVCRVDSCSLIEALNTTNANADANTINFAVGVTGTISTGTTPIGLYINNPVTINGPGARLLSIDGATLGRMFYVDASDVTISGLSLLNGNITNNDGGAIYHNGGTLTLIDCAVSFNHATSATNGGGAILNQNGTTLNLVRCTFYQNRTNSFGGAIYNGGIFNATNCSFNNNTALNGGGIISRFANGLSNTTLRNCTIAYCSAASSGNTSGDGGGGLYAEGGAQQYHLANNIIANNSSNSSSPVNPDLRGQVTSDGHNFIGIIGNAALLTNGENRGDQVGNSMAAKNPMFGPYANNGGPTDTLPLTSASTAINAGDNNFAPLTDQRGYLRSGVSDIGAYEFNGTVPPPVSLTSAVSRKTHNGLGPFDVNLMLASGVGVESRSGGAGGNHTIVFTFANTLTTVGSPAVTSGIGYVSNGQIGSDAHQYVVDLTGVTNAEMLTLSLSNVTDSAGNNSAAKAVTFGTLLGDANADGFVNAADATITRNRSGQVTDGTNFRTDYNLDGAINAADATVVRAQSGTSFPGANEPASLRLDSSR
ncbi:MAG: dockerin type I domain-containing protein [Verrucomicrobiota bacterium]|nr:dockerin type I domain-containing protein [Verrucomicrobiota bacterium]